MSKLALGSGKLSRSGGKKSGSIGKKKNGAENPCVLRKIYPKFS
jgi:hypothetical protein